MARPRRVIRDERVNPEKSVEVHDETVEAQQDALPVNRRVLHDYRRRPFPSGDPASPSGVNVELSELADDVIDSITVGGSGTRLEVILTFPDTVLAGVVFNIQDGTYSGGGPATVDGDTMKLSPSGVEFEGDGRFQVFLNGQELTKGPSIGVGCAQWLSSTQLALSVKIHSGNTVSIRGPDLT